MRFARPFLFTTFVVKQLYLFLYIFLWHEKQNSRRNFIKHIGLGSIATGIVPVSLLANETANKNINEHVAEKNIDPVHNYNESYSGEYLNRIAFPVGGMGAGMFCIEGTGAVSICLCATGQMFLMSLHFLQAFLLKAVLQNY